MDIMTPVIFSAFAAALAAVGFAGLAFKRFYVTVDPDEYVVHYRNGRVLHIGRGKSFFCMPFDTYLKVPGTMRDINFCADQITVETQGVRVQGFLAYKIDDFDRAYQALDFKSHQVRVLPPCEENSKRTDYNEKNAVRVLALDPRDPLAKTDVILRQLAESVVRHEVSNKTLHQMITEREKVRESMKKQLMETVDSWGITIDTIEFTEVWVRSKEVFENLQAGYRNQLKFEAERTTHETAQLIAEKRLESERNVALMESDSERARRVAASSAQLEASKVEVENQRVSKEQIIAAEAGLAERERQRKHEAAVKESSLALERKLLEERNRLQAQEREHEVALDQREKLEVVKAREAETTRRLAELEAKKQMEQAELTRQRTEIILRARMEEEEAKVKMRLAIEQSEADAKRISAEARAKRIIQLAEAARKAAVEAAEGTRATGAAEAEALAMRVNAENQVNHRQIQKLLVAEMGRMAEKMKVDGVNWINIGGGGEGGNESPLGIIPRNIVQILGIFKGMGMGLDDILHGKPDVVVEAPKVDEPRS